jgi:rSAM/selenodomain-associated transferase 1
MDEGSDLPGSIALGIMCKAPSAGTTKTRLSPPLSRDEAAELSRCFIADVANVVGGLPPELGVCGFLVFTPSEAERAFEGLLPGGFGLLPQRGEDLSERCANALEDLLAQGCAGACLLNSDSPTLPTAPLEAAVAALRRPGERVVLGPALDGGYYLIGAKRPVPGLFRAIAWSTGRLLAETEARAGAFGLAVDRLPAWYDVDDGLALAWLVQELLGDGTPPVANGLRGSPAPRTRAYLSALAGRGEGPPPSGISDQTHG